MRRRLGRLQALDERQVVQDRRGVGVGQLRKEVVLELRQRDFELVLLPHERLLLLLEFGLLHIHDHGEDLVLEPVRGDDEVDDGALCGDLGPVMRVRQLRLQVELEFRVVVDLLAADFDDHRGPAPLDHRAREHRLEDGVYLLANGLDEELRSHLDAEQHLLEPVVHGELQDRDVLAEALLDPLHALQLRVDHQGPAARAGEDEGVLDRHLVVGQLVDHPLPDVHLVPDHRAEAELRRGGHRVRLHQLHPSLNGVLAVLAHEGPQVCDYAAGNEDVTGEVGVLLAEVLRRR
mmetsp:Transcript_82585/g.234252  ORF Transcript_82585/g.234252 Transcript_82585/m.234252 type:complete len:291 (+) Transcript_82585:2639-3511(+)